MLINIGLTALFWALLGAIARRIVGGRGGFLHLVLVRFLGYMISDTIRSIFGLDEIGLVKILLLDLACTCAVVKTLGWLELYLIKQEILAPREPEQYEDIDETNTPKSK